MSELDFSTSQEELEDKETTLDDLLGLNDSESGSGTEEDTSFNEEEEYVLEEEHVRVSTKKVSDILKTAGVVSKGSGRDVVARTIGFKVEGGQLWVMITDADIYVKKAIPLLNSSNVLEDFIPVSLPAVMELVKLCGSTFTLFKKDGAYFLKVMGGDAEVEVVDVGEDQFSLDFVGEKESLGSMTSNTFYQVLKNLYPLANSGVTPSQRRIFFSDKGALSVYLISVAMFDKEKFPKMDLSVKDIKILYVLTSSSEAKELHVYRQENRIYLSTNDFVYSVGVADYSPSKNMLESVEKIIASNSPVYVNYNQLSKAADHASNTVNGSISRIFFSYTEDGFVKASIKKKDKRKDINMVLMGAPNDSPKQFSGEVSIQSNLLRSLLKVFAQDSMVGLILNKDGIGVVSDSFKSVLYIDSE